MILPRLFAGEGDHEVVEGADVRTEPEFAPSTPAQARGGPPPPFASLLGRIK